MNITGLPVRFKCDSKRAWISCNLDSTYRFCSSSSFIFLRLPRVRMRPFSLRFECRVNREAQNRFLVSLVAYIRLNRCYLVVSSQFVFTKKKTFWLRKKIKEQTRIDQVKNSNLSGGKQSSLSICYICKQVSSLLGT